MTKILPTGIDNQQFVDALHECLGLPPLYDSNEIKSNTGNLSYPRTLARLASERRTK